MSDVHHGYCGLAGVGSVTECELAEFSRACLTSEGLSRFADLRRTMSATAAADLLDEEDQAADAAERDVRSLRERWNVSREELAARLQVSVATVAAWERGVRRPSGPALVLLGMVRERGLEAIG